MASALFVARPRPFSSLPTPHSPALPVFAEVRGTLEKDDTQGPAEDTNTQSGVGAGGGGGRGAAGSVGRPLRPADLNSGAGGGGGLTPFADLLGMDPGSVGGAGLSTGPKSSRGLPTPNTLLQVCLCVGWGGAWGVGWGGAWRVTPSTRQGFVSHKEGTRRA